MPPARALVTLDEQVVLLEKFALTDLQQSMRRCSAKQ
jgi:hypothetical protein